MKNNPRITLTIDGKKIISSPGKSILDIARENKIEIPTLCHDPNLKPYGSCLLCVVEIAETGKLLLSCTTEAQDKMVVITKNERIHAARKSALELLLSNHFADCIAPCSDRCPADVDIQGYLALAKAGKYQEALQCIQQTKNLTAHVLRN